MKLTPQHIEAQIASEQYISSRDNGLSLGTLTICVLTLQNGINVVGKSACLDERNFDAQAGRDLARKNAVSKIWELEGYAAATLRAAPTLFVGDAPVVMLPRGPGAKPDEAALQEAYKLGEYHGFRDGYKAAEAAALVEATPLTGNDLTVGGTA